MVLSIRRTNRAKSSSPIFQDSPGLFRNSGRVEKTQNSNLTPDLTPDYSSTLKSELLNKGYREVVNSDGTSSLLAPEETYTSYWTKNASSRQYGKYAPEEYVFSKDGTLIKQVKNQPYVVESTSGWAIREVKSVEVKTYDYVNNQVNISQDYSSPQTFSHIASLQRLTPQSSQVSIPDNTAYSYNLNFGGNSSDIQVKALKEPTYAATREFFIQQNKPTTYYESLPKASVAKEEIEMINKIKNNPLAEVKVLTAEEASKELKMSLREDRDYYLTIPKEATKKNNLLQSKSNYDVLKSNPKNDGFSERIDALMKAEKDFYNLPVFEILQNKANYITFGKGIPYESRGFLGKSGQLITFGILSFPLTIPGTIYFGGGKIAAGVEGMFKTPKETSKEIFFDAPKRTISAAFNPTTPEGFSTFLTAAVGAKIIYKDVLAAKFLKSVTGEETIRGKTYFGEQIINEEVNANLLKKSAGIEVTKEGVVPFEKVIATIPKEVITLSKSDKTFFVKLSSGEQVSTTLGKGLYKDLFMRTTTSPEGKSVSTIFRNKNFGFKEIKTFLTKDTPILAATESQRVKNGYYFDELKVADMTLQIEQEVKSGNFISTQKGRKGIFRVGEKLVATGEFVEVSSKEVGVVTTMPKFNLKINSKAAELDVFRTEFELVDYTPIPEVTNVFKNGRNIFDVERKLSDLSNIKYPAQLKFVKNLGKGTLGDYWSWNDRIRINIKDTYGKKSYNLPGVLETDTPTLYHELGHKFIADYGFKLSSKQRKISNQEMFSQEKGFPTAGEVKGYYEYTWRNYLKKLPEEKRLSAISEELFSDTFSNFIKDQENFARQRPYTAEIFRSKLGKELYLKIEADKQASLRLEKTVEFTQKTNLKQAQRFEIKIGRPTKNKAEALSIKKLGLVDKSLIDYAKKKPKFKEYKPVNQEFSSVSNDNLVGGFEVGKLQESALVTDRLLRSLKEYDPYGLSEDRIRGNVVLEPQILKVNKFNIDSDNVNQNINFYLPQLSNPSNKGIFKFLPSYKQLSNPTTFEKEEIFNKKNLVFTNKLNSVILSKSNNVNEIKDNSITRNLNRSIAKDETINKSLNRNLSKTRSLSESKLLTKSLTRLTEGNIVKSPVKTLKVPKPKTPKIVIPRFPAYQRKQSKPKKLLFFKGVKVFSVRDELIFGKKLDKMIGGLM